MNAATKATIAAMISTYGFAAHTALKAANTPFAALITPASFGMIVMIVPIVEMTFPTIISTGPIAAATSATVTMTFLVPSSIELSQASVLKDLSEADAIKKVGELFTADMKKSGILASVSLAQFILESGYGKSELAQNANNIFRMKCSLSGNTWSGSVCTTDWISELEDAIAEIEEKISGAYGEKITADELYKVLLSFDRMYFKMTDLEKKRFMRDFIDEIELYPERQEDGRILKQLHLGFPVFYEGSEGDTIRLLKQNTVETVVLLSK